MIVRDSQIARLPKQKLFPQRSAPRKWIWIGTSAGLLLLFFRVLGRAQDPAVADAAIGILEAKCALCHGPSKMSGLDVRQHETLPEEACVAGNRAWEGGGKPHLSGRCSPR